MGSPRALLLLLLALVASAACANTDLEETVRKTIEDFRATMTTGVPDAGIPVTEPLVVPALPLTVKVPPFDAQCNASNVIVPGLSAFKLTKVSQVDGTNKVSVAVQLADMEVKGQYDLHGKVKIGFISYKLNDTGPFEFLLKNFNGGATADIVVHEDGTLSLGSISVDDWTYKSIKVQLDNILGGGILGSTVNKLINALVPTFVKLNRDKINQLAEKIGMLYINKYLDAIAGRPTTTDLPHLASGLALHLGAESQPFELVLDEEVLPAEAKDILDQLALLLAGVPERIVLQPQQADSSSDLVNQVTELLEDFRSIMGVGQPDLDIPVLDPCVIRRMPVEVKIPPFDALAEATDVHVAGVSKFIIHTMEQNPGTNELFVSIEVPKVNVSGQYRVSGSVDLGFAKIELNGGSGKFAIKMKEFRGTATTDMIVNPDGTLNVNWFRFDTWHFDDIQIEVENLPYGQYVTPLINKLAPYFLELNRGWINNWGQTIAKEYVNRYLDGIAGRPHA